MSRYICPACVFVLLIGPALADDLDDMIVAFEAGANTLPVVAATTESEPAPELILTEALEPAPLPKGASPTSPATADSIPPTPVAQNARPVPPDPSADWASRAAYIRARLAWLQAQRAAAVDRLSGGFADEPS
jgi:hypothetical protein